MTETLRGPLLTAQREISALDLKRGKVLSKISANESKEREPGAYVDGTTMVEKVQNAAIKTGFASNLAKLKTELAMVDAQIKDHKQIFGLEIFQIFVDMEDMEGWLPTVRDIRSIYDQARRDIEKIQARRKQKEEELTKVGGVPMTNSSEKSQYNEPTMPQPVRPENTVANNYFQQAASAEASHVPATIPVETPIQPGPPIQQQGYGTSTNVPTSYGSQGMTVATSAVTTNGTTGFAANGAAPAAMMHSNSFGSAGYPSSGPQQPMDPFQGNSMMTQQQQPGLGPPPTMTAPDPFASSFQSAGPGVPPPSMDHSQNSFTGAAPMGSGGTFSTGAHDPFATLGSQPLSSGPSAPSNNNDPFSAFDSLQQDQQSQGHQNQPSNPLFRY